VADTGRGLSPTELEEVFEPFARLGHHSGTVTGAGVGLSISRKLMRLMGGEVGAESHSGGGSVFRLDLAPGAVPGARGTD
jgi:signal transduction histidine kinase